MNDDQFRHIVNLVLSALETVHNEVSSIRAEMAGFEDGVRLYLATMGVSTMSGQFRQRLQAIASAEAMMAGLITKLIAQTHSNHTTLAAVPDILASVETTQATSIAAVQAALDAQAKLDATLAASGAVKASDGAAGASGNGSASTTAQGYTYPQAFAVGSAGAGTDTGGDVPKMTAAPVISGPNPPVVGTALSVSDGEWTSDETPTFDYQWYDDDTGNPIAGAKSKTYVPQPSDISHALGVAVVATNSAGSNTGFSDPTGNVTASAGDGGASTKTVTDPVSGVQTVVQVDAAGNPIA